MPPRAAGWAVLASVEAASTLASVGAVSTLASVEVVSTQPHGEVVAGAEVVGVRAEVVGAGDRLSLLASV